MVDTEWNGMEEKGEIPQSQHTELTDADVVTITIGGNDAFFIDVIKECRKFTNQCHWDFYPKYGDTFGNLVPKWIEFLRHQSKLPLAFDTIRSMAPNADIYVLRYPPLLAEISEVYYDVLSCEFTVQEAKRIREWTEQLNCVIEEEVIKMEDDKFFFVPVSEEFAGHEIGSAGVPWINAVRFIPTMMDSFHPNSAGHKAFAKALQKRIDNKTVKMKSIGERRTTFKTSDRHILNAPAQPLPSIENLLIETEESSPCCNHEVYTTGQRLVIQGKGFNADSSVQIFYEGDIGNEAIHVLDAVADSNGALNEVITLPTIEEQSALGTLNALGVRPDGGVLLLRGMFLAVSSLEKDTDEDGIPDPCDNCPEIVNSGQENLDRDSLGDPCDPCPNDPENDLDGDGLCALDDICPYDPKNDIDSDGICGDDDNCPSVYNPQQEDSDINGVGDACQCAGDMDGDQDVDGKDLAIFAGDLGIISLSNFCVNFGKNNCPN